MGGDENVSNKVVFFNGLGEQVAEIFQGKAPKGFETTWRPHRLPNDEKLPLVREADFLVLHPAEIAEDVLREAKKLRLLQLLTAGYDKIDLRLAGELGIPVATNGGANAWAGRALRREQPAGRTAVLWLAVLNLFVLPFGTALGIYAFWVLLHNETRAVFVSTGG